MTDRVFQWMKQQMDTFNANQQSDGMPTQVRMEPEIKVIVANWELLDAAQQTTLTTQLNTRFFYFLEDIG